MAKLKRPESVLVVIYSALGRVLVLQRKDDPNFWQSVTGSLEDNETPIQTAYREVEEELGLTLDPHQHAIVDCRRINQFEIRPEWRSRYPKSMKYNTEYTYTLRIEETTNFTLSEHIQYEWLTKQEALSRVWSKSNQQGIRDFVPDNI